MSCEATNRRMAGISWSGHEMETDFGPVRVNAYTMQPPGQCGDGFDNAWPEGSTLGALPGETFVVMTPEAEAELGRDMLACDEANPKDAAGAAKPQMGLVPLVAAVARVMELGARKYGPYNWRSKPVKKMVYVHAALRHLMMWIGGQTIDPESGESHLAHVAACMLIVLDAEAHKVAIDDREWLQQEKQ